MDVFTRFFQPRRLREYMGLAVSVVGETASFLRTNSCRLRPSFRRNFEQRQQPTRLEALCKLTGFTKQEIQTLYRGFKEACPSGQINEEEFKQHMSHWFPGGTGAYAALVFKTFDANSDSMVTFKEFAMALATLLKGTTEEKLAWIFYLYDVDNDGYISPTDMYHVVKAVYDMTGQHVNPPIRPSEVKKHAADVYKKFDKHNHGRVSCDEFMACCMEDPVILASLTNFNTIFYTQQNSPPGTAEAVLVPLNA